MPKWLKRHVSQSYYYFMCLSFEIQFNSQNFVNSEGEKIGSGVAISSEPTPEQSWGGDLSSSSVLFCSYTQ